MNAGVFLKSATDHLEKAGIGTARLDMLVLLEDELKKDRAYLLTHPETVLEGTTLRRLESRLKRRARHEPLAYIRGFTEFYGRRFAVNKDVLEPRPESETMIDLLKTLRLPFRLRIADIGAGSGALGITAALEMPSCSVDLYEIDEAALKVSERNLQRYKLNLRSYHSDLLTRRAGDYDVILANLPYVPSRYVINQAASREPRQAIFGGGNGLEIYRRLFYQLNDLSISPSFVLTEAMPPQHYGLASIAEVSGFKLHRSQDFIQVFVKNTQPS